MKLTQRLTLLALAIVTTTAIHAQDQSPVPDGSAGKISDWALAGVIWSDASLVKKLATQAAEEADSPEQAARFKKLSEQSSQIVDAMEAFGWKQVKSTAKVGEDLAAKQGGGSRALPDPEDVGAALADSMNLADDGSTTPERQQRRASADDENSLGSSIKRFDTETPAGRDDPGMDDERVGDGMTLDVDSYRVDDYIDETPAEARNRADAIEDGVEGAIAAAAGRRGMGTGNAGRISEREAQTRSATMPYSQDSIYDSDDYDPDIDYNVDNPLGMNSTNPASVDRGDGNDDIDRDDPAKVVEGEDEMIAAMAREEGTTRNPTTPSSSANRNNLDRYTTERSKYSQDANWVQFHLDANQAVWRKFTTRESLNRRTSDALMKLRADVSVAIEATDNERLKNVLEQIRQ